MRQSLSRDLLPTHYDLHFDVKDGESYTGKVVIHTETQNTLSEIKINSQELDLKSINVNGLKSTGSENDGFVTISIPEKVSGEVKIEIEFEGKYNTGMKGFYKSMLKDSPMFSTHFEPADARRAFPCFDQPDMKATYSVSIKAPEGFVALANSQLISSEDNLFKFEKTPKMSTYIVAFVVGKLDYIEAYTTGVVEKGNKRAKKGIPVRVYSHPEEKAWGQFALDVAVRCLSFFEEYFEIDYPLPKLDMVAIPSFAMGAMENWGLVTYRDTSLLFDEKSTSILSKMNIANTVCHELAHMWFGNLVTMDWWNDLWLNEGFATWAASLAIEKSQQEIIPWDVWTSFISDDIESGMKRDSLKSTHKISIEVNAPSEIDQIFDAISYSKGSSVIKMLENWVGAEVFRKGLVNYLGKYKYSNAVTKNLWDSLTEEVQKSDPKAMTVDSVIDPWITREGFPYIEVTEKDDSLVLTQSRFTLGYVKEDDPWPIPVKILWLPENKVDKFIMNERTMKIKKLAETYKINDGVSGFYRVLYPDSIFEKLVKANVSVQNRLNLFGDAFALGKGLYGKLPLKYTPYLKEEQNYEVLSHSVREMSNLRSIFYDSPEHVKYLTEKINEVISHRIATVDLSNPGSDVNEVLVNSLVISMSASIGNEETLKKLTSTDRKNVHAEFLRSYYIANIDSKFDETYKIYLEAASPQERVHALFALGKTKSKQNLNFIFDNFNKIRPHESLYLFASLGSNIELRHEAFDLYLKNFNKVKEVISDEGLLRHTIEYLLPHVLAEGYRERAIEFLNSLSEDPYMKSAIETTLDSIDINTKLRQSINNNGFE